jgi:DNA-directed RNA polymerase beta subunit
LSNENYSLSIENLAYTTPDYVDVDEQKKVILENKNLTRKLRGEWVLRDSARNEISRTGQKTIMNVPMMTERGTFIKNGKEYAFSHIMRLTPGVYVKNKTKNINAQFNITKGTGAGFQMNLNPATGVFTVNKGTVNAPAYTVFRDLGITDDQMRESWGKDIFEANKKAGETEKATTSALKIYGVS